MGNSITVKQVADTLSLVNNILILTHRRPDGDTTGCAGALCAGLRQLGKTAYVMQNPEITTRYNEIIKEYYPQDDFSQDFIVSVDIADTTLLALNATDLIDKIDLAIDHHRSNPLFAKQNIVNSGAGACGELIYEILIELGVTIDKAVALPLYYAVSTDTGCFKFSNTTPDTHKVAAACLEAGIDGGEINRALFELKSRARINMERILFENMEFYQDGKIAMMTMYRKDVDVTGATVDDLDSISGLPRQIEGVQVGVTFTENKDGTCKISVRTTKEVDASAICAKVGGGGHLRAAGASFESVEQAQREMREITQAVYKNGN